MATATVMIPVSEINTFTDELIIFRIIEAHYKCASRRKWCQLSAQMAEMCSLD